MMRLVFVVTVQISACSCHSIQVNVWHIAQVVQPESECHPTLSAVVQHFTTSWTVTTAAERRQATNNIAGCHWCIKLIAQLLPEWI